jgi:hypothetical protein
MTERGYSNTTIRHKASARAFWGYNNTIVVDERLFDIVKNGYKKEYMINELELQTKKILNDLHESILKSRKSKKLDGLKQTYNFYNDLLNDKFEVLF